MENVILDRPNLPVLFSSDVVVVGGSFAGISAALGLARAGRSVVLVERRTYLGREVTATLRPWIPVPQQVDKSALPELITACIDASGTKYVGGEFPLHMDAVKTRLEDLLIDAGVRTIYATLPIALCTAGDVLESVIIGNKSGRQVLKCRTLLDATSNALVTQMTGAKFAQPPKQTAKYAMTLEFDQVAFQQYDDMIESEGTFSVPPHLGVVGNQVITHRGSVDGGYGWYFRGHALVECWFELPSRADTGIELTQRYFAAREKTLDVASHLLWDNHYFRLAILGTVSQELHGPRATPMADLALGWARTLDAAVVEIVDSALQRSSAPLSSFATPIFGVWCLNEAARLDLPVLETLRDPVSTCVLGDSLARALVQHWDMAAVTGVTESAVRSTTPPPAAEPAKPSQLQVKEPESPQRGRAYEWHPVTPSQIPVVADVDVLVVGGGTSGAIAAIAAAREGVRTFVVEMNPGLGGTATYGGVKYYWTGWQDGYTAQSREWVNKVHDLLRYPRTYGRVGGWNMEAKIQSLTQEAENVGAEVLTNALVVAALVEGDAVRGVIVATPTGPVALLGKVVVDATGDGDVAAFAGAAFTYGSARDHAVMWYSLAQIGAPGSTHNNFTSMVDVSNILDYNRAVLSGRRRGRRRGGQLLDHGSYIATRESRHIEGDVFETLTDHLLNRCWPDVINIAVSNNDIKGQINSDWMRVGLIPPNLEIESPYRILLPKGLDNILVVGKAVSAAHDALSAIRMQPDFENQGGVAGLAAAMAVQGGKSPRDVDIQGLQERLVEIGVLPQHVLTRRLIPLEYTDAELQALIEVVATDDRPLRDYSMMELDEVHRARIPFAEICCAGPRAIPLLEKSLERTEGSGRLRLALALAMMGSSTGVPALISAVQDQLAGEQLPERVAAVKHVETFAPDQAAMPDVAYLIYALGLTRDQRAIPIWQRVVDLLAQAEEEDVWSQPKGVFHYVDAVCFGAEQLGDPAAIPLLKQLHGYSPFSHKQLTDGFQADYLLERAAYIEVVIGRSLSRCGGADGLIILINYLNDVRTLLAEQAHDELIAVTSQDFGKDVAAWSQWLELEGENLQPVPRVGTTDPMSAWEDTILTTAADD